MSETTKKPLPKIGVDRYTFFKVTSEADGQEVYGDAYHLKGTVEIAPTDNGGSEPFDADNGVYDTQTYVENMGHEITNADIPPEVDAMWRGIEQKGGMVEFGDETKAPYFAVAWRILKSDGTYRYVRYYKGSYSFASNVGAKTKPSKGAPESQTAQATYTAVKNNSGKYYAYIDSADIPEGEKDAFEENWFSDPTYYPSLTVEGEE